MNQFNFRAAAAATRKAAALMCVVGLLCSAGVASAEPPSGEMASEAGLGLGSVFASLIYGPTKVLYAITGATVGGLAYVFSGGDANVAEVVLTPSVRGDYVITPSHLRGEREIEFLGRKPAYRAPAESVAQVPEASW